MFELAIRITDRLYQARDTMKSIHGANWEKALEPYKAVLQGLHKEKGIPYLELGQQLAKEMQNQDINPVMVLAAMVELMEPSQGVAP